MFVSSSFKTGISLNASSLSLEKSLSNSITYIPAALTTMASFLYLWTLISFLIKRIANNSCFSFFNTFSNKFIVNWFFNKYSATSNTTLTLIKEQTNMVHFNSVVDVTICKHNAWTFPTKFKCDIL